MTSLSILIFILHISILSAFDFGMNFENSFFEINIDRDHPDRIYKEFQDFIVKYKRTYKDEFEKKFRFEQFTKTHNQVGKMNNKAKQAGHDTVYGINKFSDRSKEEMNKMFTTVAPSKNPKVPMFGMNQTRVKRQLDHLPKKFDLTEKKIGGRYVIGEIKNQNNCSCCWAFAATALAEIAYSVHLKKMTTLSDQEVCDCAAKHGPGCSGGLPEDGLEYIREIGLTSEEEYPYFENRSTVAGLCDAEEHDRELNPLLLSYYTINPFNAEYLITRHLFEFKVPVAVAFRVGQSFKDYENGVMQMTDCDDEKKPHWHSGVIVGYGTTKNLNGIDVDFWIFRNSWATDWGMRGYARIIRGEDWCNIESHGYGAVVPD